MLKAFFKIRKKNGGGCRNFTNVSLRLGRVEKKREGEREEKKGEAGCV